MPTTIEKSFRRLHVTDDGKTIAAHERDNDVDEGVRVAIMTELGNSESFYSTPEDEPPSLQCVDGNSNGSYSQPLSSSSSDQRGPSWIPVHAPTCQHRWHTEHPHRPLHRFQHHNYPHTTAHDLPKPHPRASQDLRSRNSSQLPRLRCIHPPFSICFSSSNSISVPFAFHSCSRCSLAVSFASCWPDCGSVLIVSSCCCVSVNTASWSFSV